MTPSPPSKLCRRCREVKPLDDFTIDRRRPDGRGSWCSPCRKAYRAEKYAEQRDDAIRYAREWKQANPDKVRTYGLRYRHGIEPEDFDAMLAAQDGKCAICGVSHASEILRVDHDHETGALRGLLCDLCNRGLGYFADEAVRLRAAARYLEDPPCPL